MKKALSASLLALALCQPAPANAAKTYELTFTSEGYRENHVVFVNVWKPWMEEIEKRSQGRLKIVFYSPGTICSSKEVPDAVIKGRVDIGHSLFGANPGLYGYADTGEANIPGVNSMAASMGFHSYINENEWVKNELDNDRTKLLAVWSTGPMMVCSTSPMTKVSDFKGKKIGYHTSGVDRIITALGGVPVPVSPPDIYMSVQRGQTDTQFFALTILQPFRLYEVLSDIMDFPMAPGYHYLIMNRKVWDELPEDLRAILDESTGETMSRQVGSIIDAEIDTSLEWVHDNDKCTLNVMSNNEKAKMRDALAPFRAAWVADREKRGLTRAKEAIDLFAACMERANAEYGQ